MNLAYLLLTLFHLGESFYVPIATSKSVSKVARSIKLEGSTIVVSRNSNENPIAFHDYCPHRGASFDKAVLGGNNISCKYHGFKFDINDGDLVEGLGVKSGCSSLKMVECVEKGGLIWACIDEDDTVKPPSELDQETDPSFRKVSGSVIIKCPVNRLIENVQPKVWHHLNIQLGIIQCLRET